MRSPSPGYYIFQFAFRAGPFVCFDSIVDGFSHFFLVFCVTEFLHVVIVASMNSEIGA